MNRDTIINTISDLGIHSPNVVSWNDDNYGCFSREFIYNEFTTRLRELRKTDKIRYERNAWACNASAAHAQIVAKLLWLHDSKRTKETAPVVLQFGFSPRTGPPDHCILLFLVADKKTQNPVPFFYDPQLCKQVFLTNPEIKSCTFLQP